MSKTPAYKFQDFVEACSLYAEAVIPLGGVLDSAKNDFGIQTFDELCDFIGNNGLEALLFIEQQIFHKSKDIPPPMVDVYKFRTNRILGYLAFVKSSRGKWLIKSFHKDRNRIGSIDTMNSQNREII